MNKEKKIKLLVIPSWYPPNGGQFFREHAFALASAGLEVEVLAAVHTSLRKLRPSSLFGPARQCISSNGITEHLRKYWIIPFSDKPNFHGWVNNMLRFFKKYLKENSPPDIILAHSSIWAGLVAAFIKEQYGIPYIITEHRSRFVYNTAEARAMFQPWFFPYLQTAFEGADKIITVSDSLQDSIKKMAPGLSQPLMSIPNMVNTFYFTPSGKKKPESTFTFFSLANLISLKGMDTLISAFALFGKQKTGPCKLIIGGDGPERNRLEAMVKEKGLQKEVSFLGKLNRQQVKAQMQQAHAFVLASHFEAFGVVYIEAMACGLPVIATRAGGPESFIRESEGILTEAGNEKALAVAMENMMLNFSSYDSGSIRQYAESNFGNEAVALKYKAIIEEII